MNLRLLNAIKLSGSKQWQIARRANLSEVRLSKIVNENCVQIIEAEKRSIAIALEMPIGELFSTEETEYLTGNE